MNTCLLLKQKGSWSCFPFTFKTNDDSSLFVNIIPPSMEPIIRTTSRVSICTSCSNFFLPSSKWVVLPIYHLHCLRLLFLTKHMPKTLVISENFHMKTIKIMASYFEANTTTTTSKSWVGYLNFSHEL